MSRRHITPMADWQLERGRLIWDTTDNHSPEMRNWISEVFDTLPNTDEQPHRSVVEMRIWGKYTYKEIAEELGLKSKANAHDLYNRAIKWLRDGRIVEVGEDEHTFKVQFKGLGEEVDRWL